MKLWVGCPVAAHVPEHVASFEQLKEKLAPLTIDFAPADYRKPQDFGPAMWTRAGLSDATHALFLNDDAIPCDGFAEVLGKVIAARPDDIIALFCNSAIAPALGHKGFHWYTSAEGLVGVAYVMPIPVVRDLVSWRETWLMRKEIPDDSQVNLFAMVRKLRIWHTIPALVDHPADLPSLLGNDIETRNTRVASVPPMADMRHIDWTVTGVVPYIGRLYKGNHWDLVRCLTLPDWKRAYELERETPDRTLQPVLEANL